MSALRDRVTVRVFSTLKDVFGQTEIGVPFEQGCDLKSLLMTICSTPQRQRAIFLDTGLLKPELQVLVNGRNVRFLDGLQTDLRSGDEVAVFPPMYGG